MRPPYFQVADPRTYGNSVVLGRKFCSMCGRWRQVNDFERKAGGLRAHCRGCARAYDRRKRREMNASQRARVRERRRFVRTLPVAPLLEAMEAHIAWELRNGYDPNHPNGAWGGWEGLAALAGVSSRSLRRMYLGESKRVRLDTADVIAVALDIPLSLLYPEG